MRPSGPRLGSAIATSTAATARPPTARAILVAVRASYGFVATGIRTPEDGATCVAYETQYVAEYGWNPAGHAGGSAIAAQIPAPETRRAAMRHGAANRLFTHRASTTLVPG
jgi:hypothetical protein